MTRLGLLLLICLSWGGSTRAGTPAKSAAAAMVVPWMGCFELASRTHGVPLDLLIAVGSVESNWDAGARSTANAHGVMQIQWPGTARHLGIRRVSELYNPCLNIDLGATYLAELTRRYDGDVRLSLAAYNYGPGRVVSGGRIPGSVERYIDKVIEAQDQLARRNGLKLNQSAGSEELELIRFRHRSLAENYAASLARRIPGADLNLVETRRGDVIIYLNITTLMAEDRIRLAAIVPHIF